MREKKNTILQLNLQKIMDIENILQWKNLFYFSQSSKTYAKNLQMVNHFDHFRAKLTIKKHSVYIFIMY